MAEHVQVIDRGYNEIKKNFIKTGKGKVVSVGWQGDQAGIDHDGITNVEIASTMEFGTKDGKIPERPMFRQTYDTNVQKYDKELTKIVSGFFKGGTLEGQLMLLGESFKADIIRTVKSNPFKAWKESTAKQKEREGKSGDVVLYDSGQMINALGVIVIDTGDKK